jgi:hypothetical protein
MIKFETHFSIEPEPESNSIAYLDELLLARDHLFDVQLSKGLGAHRRMIELVTIR